MTTDDDQKNAEPATGFRVVARFLGVAEAELAISALRAAGIDARPRDQHTVGINWLYAPAIGGVGVEVPADRLDEARELLESAEIDAEPLSEEEQALHASGLERRRHRGLWATFLFAPWLWLIWRLGTWRRRDSGHRDRH